MNYSHGILNSLNTKKTKTFDVGNPGPGLVQAQKWGGIKPVNGFPTLSSYHLHALKFIIYLSHPIFRT